MSDSFPLMSLMPYEAQLGFSIWIKQTLNPAAPAGYSYVLFFYPYKEEEVVYALARQQV